MTWHRTQLLFTDLFLLKLIIDYHAEHHTAPRKAYLFQTRGKGALNARMEGQGVITAGYATLVRANPSFTASTALLRELRLLKKRRFYTPSQRGEKLVEQLGADWKAWPVNLPFDGGHLCWENAVYLENML